MAILRGARADSQNPNQEANKMGSIDKKNIEKARAYIKDWRERLLIDDDLVISIVENTEDLANECQIEGRNARISVSVFSLEPLISLEEIVVHELLHIKFPRLEEEEVRDLAVTLTQLRKEDK